MSSAERRKSMLFNVLPNILPNIYPKHVSVGEPKNAERDKEMVIIFIVDLSSLSSAFLHWFHELIPNRSVYLWYATPPEISLPSCHSESYTGLSS